jgi:hypothetical protein
MLSSKMEVAVPDSLTTGNLKLKKNFNSPTVTIPSATGWNPLMDENLESIDRAITILQLKRLGLPALLELRAKIVAQQQ